MLYYYLKNDFNNAFYLLLKKLFYNLKNKNKMN